ncbi:hypothetical protein [Bradyrhizobium sp. ERR14]|uniref:hypothetical protein n=1 Tax=Bradyrhizobium sp. ERR14 TaxID=2663837 RepID=UPI00161B86C8|nr:hypothetical protein [Bradyrhizobium sp. ERR14]MBB4396676.1 hypothetical protein [Bradyrhizobium sp. ERR14]
MIDDMMNLRTLVEKTPDADLLREMIGLGSSCRSAAQGLAVMSVSDQCAAALNATNQALAAAREGRDELAKLQSGSLAKSAAALAKTADQLEKIRDGLLVLEASNRAHPQQRSTQ